MSSTEDNTDDTTGIPEVTPEPIVLRTRRTLVTPSSPVVDYQTSQQSEPQTPPIRFTSARYYTEEPDDSLLNDNSTASQSNISSETEGRTEVINNQNATRKDTWNSFLSELSKVENQFFNPTKTTNDKKVKDKNVDSRTLANGRRSVAAALPSPPPDIDGSDSDEEAVILPPPPAPRTFYA
jgi:hypothetical protein